MHRDLYLSSLNRLPLHIRRIANAACAANRSREDVQRLIEAMNTVAKSTAPHLLPAIYILLDPQDIPGVEQLDNFLGIAQQSFLPLVEILRGVLTMPIPRHLVPDLWPRIWKWVYFTHTYRDSLPGLVLDEATFCFEFLRFVGRLYDKPQAVDFMCVELGFHYMIARAWKYILDSPDAELRDVLLQYLCLLLTGLGVFSNPAVLAEMLDAIGGVDGITFLLTKNFSYLVETRKAPLVLKDSAMLQSLSRFTIQMESFGLGFGSVRTDTGPVLEALRNHGFLPVLSKAASALAETPDVAADTPLGQCFILLARLLNEGTGLRWLPSAVDHLLCAIVLAVQLHQGDDVQEGFELFITATSSSLLYHGIPDVFATALERLKTPPISVPSKGSAIREMWQRFTDLVEQRVVVSRIFESEGYLDLKACDNLKCTTIALKPAFRRCSGCQSFYYCSKECQIIDWREGEHRNACAAYGTLYLSEQQYFTARERGFLRALVHHDYCAAKIQIYTRQAELQHREPGRVVFTRFDYTQGAVNITVDTDDHAELCVYGKEWRDCVARAARGGGKLALHVVYVEDKTTAIAKARPFFVPLRKSHADLDRVFKEMTDELRGAEEKFKGAITAKFSARFERAYSDVIETH
ncbi:hypothetical protein C8R43DRAFT_1110020 [Mycena crocata]|nr:hypothetical protein C8R43DRAFT_1110020 [Mycena crocata]